MGLYANALEPGMSVCNVNACACVCVCVHVNVTSIVTIHCMFYMACLNYVAIFLFFLKNCYYCIFQDWLRLISCVRQIRLYALPVLGGCVFSAETLSK